MNSLAVNWMARRLVSRPNPSILRVLNFQATRFFSDAHIYSGDFFANEKPGSQQTRDRPFLDQLRVRVIGGHGGSGSSSFRKGKHSRKGRPDGGPGGRGGHVYFVASPEMRSLAGVPQLISGGRGVPGTSKKQVGTRGEDREVQVPVGTVVSLLEGELPDGESEVVGASRMAERLAKSQSLEVVQRQDVGIVVGGNDSGSREDNVEDGGEAVFAEGKTGGVRSAEGKILKSHKLGSSFAAAAKDDDAIEEGVCDSETEAASKIKGGLHLGEEHDADDEVRSRQEVADLSGSGQRFLAAAGGRGGKGNISMPRRFINGDGGIMLPVKSHESGKPGTTAVLLLELKLVADVGLVGAPNAGKSTLLGAMSRAQPRVGSYAFTTLRPQVGTVRFPDWFSFTVADIPGLLEGAHLNKGLGHAFLKHIERTRALVYVIDICPPEHRPRPVLQLESLMQELEAYEEGLSGRPAVVVANKMDEPEADENLEELRTWLQKVRPGLKIFPVCAILHQGISELKEGLKKLVLDHL